MSGRARVTFLGTGTSHGVPMIGCACSTCRSDDPHDRRWRTSILIDLDGTSVLVDTSTDLRAQALAFGLKRVDAILFTHDHADHILGLDEVRCFNVMQRSSIPCYGDVRTLESIRRTFAYIFSDGLAMGGGVAQLDFHPVERVFHVGGQRIVPVPLLHGRQPVLGYRVGPFAYLTDCSAIPGASWPLLDGVRLLVLDALRDRPHPTHFTVTQALEVVARLRPEHAYFTHICHDLPHQATCARLPAHVELAYDGLTLEFDVSADLDAASGER